eukprot:SAG31_NODE_23293_length_507_cov_0.772059_1_plen_62_part_10
MQRRTIPLPYRNISSTVISRAKSALLPFTVNEYLYFTVDFCPSNLESSCAVGYLVLAFCLLA